MTTAFVGREAELTRLHQLYAKALRGERQVVFVTGEAGIGKTTLVETFLSHVEASENQQATVSHSLTRSSVHSLTPSSLLIGRGQCVEQHGAGEGYLPVLESLSRICRQARGGRMIDVLQQVAPTWLMQLPAFLAPGEVAALHQRTAGATRERMLREIADALETLSAGSPLILVLEDLHWSDTSTIEMLSLLARRREPARLLVLGTYRPTELILSNHPLKAMKQELVARGQGVEVALGNLHPTDVRTYLTQRFPDTIDESVLSTFVYRRTEGHPLFMVQMADYLAQQDAQGVIASGTQGALEAAVPHGLQELIEVQLGRLTDAERQVLEVASVAGAEFAVASVTAGAQRPIEDVEAHCEGLARQGQFIEDRGLATWPDGTVSGRYGLRHALYQQVLYRRLSARQRARVHLAIGGCEETGYGERSNEIAAELAMHFERGQDVPRAVRYRQQAAETALRRNAHQEAVSHLHTGLATLRMLPDSPARAPQELALQAMLGPALIAVKGFASPTVEEVYTRARELYEQVGDNPQFFPLLWGRLLFHLFRAELPAAREMAEQMLRLADSVHDAALLTKAHEALALILYSTGALVAAQQHDEQALGFYDPQQHYPAVLQYGGADSGVTCAGRLAFILCLLGYAEQGQKTSHETLVRAQGLAHAVSLAEAWCGVAWLQCVIRDAPASQQAAERVIALCQEWGFPNHSAIATILRGWALAEQGRAAEGLGQIQEGLTVWRAVGTELLRPFFLALLAEAYQKDGQAKEGLRVVAEALTVVDKNGERDHEAHLYQLKGELMLQKLSVASCQLPVGSRKSESPQSKSRKFRVRNPQSAISRGRRLF